MVVERDGRVFMHVFLPFVMNDESADASGRNLSLGPDGVT